MTETPEGRDASSGRYGLPNSVTDSDRFLEAVSSLAARTRDTAERRESLALLKVIRLAPTLEVAEALLRGQRVPRSRLDPHWRRRYGL